MDEVIVENPDFIATWNKKKKQQEALHKRAYNRIKEMCVFSKK